MPSKSVLKRGFKAEAERIAERYRSELNISKFDPLDAFQLADHLGIPIFSVEEAFGGNENSPNFSVLNNPNSFSAMWMPNEDGDKIIIHNSKHSAYRQQSNIMHELAHIIRNHEMPEETAKLCMLFNLHYFNPLHEQEAKFLGGCLQITRAGLQWAIKRFSEEQISEYYTASGEMVKYRLNATGVLKQYNYSRNNK